jgi:tol-pal system protein YbgF
MNLQDPHIHRALWAAAVALMLATGPGYAQDSSPAVPDSSAYQMIQLLNQNEALATEIAGLRGQLEEALEQLEHAREAQKKIAVDFDTRIATLEARPEVDTSEDKARIADLENKIQQLEQAIAAMHDVVMSVAQAPAPANTSESAYESALEKYRSGNYDAAILDLQAFVQLYSDDPLAQNARYWLAEALLRQGAFDKAIDTGQLLLSDFPDTEKAPDTMFLIGKAYLELGDAAGARSAWERLAATYPLSNPATEALELLEQLP